MSSGSRKLLLADDSPTIQKVVSLTFGDEDFEVVAVGDGAQAWRALAQEPPPDVVLADVVMPGPDGYELCERIKRDERLKKIPVVLLVGTFEPFNEAEARRVGADTVLTKPFQSIRNLVGKVGSLLGGESKADEPAEAPRDERRPEESRPPAFDAARFDADARRAAPHDEAEEPRAEDPGASFADLGADDELIEARPAEDFGAPPAFARRRGDAPADPADVEPPEPDFDAAPVFETNGSAAHAPAAAASEKESDDFAAAFKETHDPEPVFAAAQPRESVMNEANAPQTSFDARAKGAAAADDSLLDLGQFGATSAAATAEADDFILDLGFDDEPVAPAEVFDSPLAAEPEPAPKWADAPSAFAEAAHGERPRPFESASSFEPPATFEPAPSFDSSKAFAQPEASLPQDDAPWRDVVVQDGPQGFAFGGEEPQGAGAAPRGFVEPEVVPADEPVPAVTDEFTDGSVEGDVSREPAAQSSFAQAAPQETSAAGFNVGTARAGLEEPLRADHLSPEAIDAIARRVVELMSDKVVREIAWEVVPELAELLIRQKLEEEKSRQ
ncbi:MAG: response regulator [Acidobacteria bacterium]|nr:response regulator [Acidobacteriota bacterium]